MKIKRLVASFGNLSNSKLELKDGLNIIQAPNESGKSTWCAFIRTMLYGINTRKITTPDKIADKDRYLPWSGAPMGGTMDVEFNGQELTIQRSALRGAAMKNLSVTRTGSGGSIKELENSDIGEALTGFTESVFRRTSFIGQSGIKIDSDPDLEKRITSLVSSGEETVSAIEAQKRLKNWQKKLRTAKGTGLLPSLQESLDKNRDKLSRIEELNSRAADTKHAIEGLTSEKKRLESLILLHEQYRLQSQRQKASDTETAVREAEQEAKALENELTLNGRRIMPSDISSMRAALSSLASLTNSKNAADAAQLAAKTALAQAKADKEASPFSRFSVEEVRSASRESEGMISDEAKHYPQAVALFAALSCLFAALTVLSKIIEPLDSAFGLLCALTAICVFMLVRFARLLGKRKKRHKFFLSLFSVSSLEQFGTLANEYFRLYQTQLDKASSLESARIQADTMSSAVFAAQKSLYQLSEPFLPGMTSPADIAAVLNSCESAAEKLSEVKIGLISGQKLIDSMQVTAQKTPDEKIIEEPEGTAEEAVRRLAAIDSRLREKSGEYNLAKGESRAIGDPLVLNSESASFKEEIKIQSAKYEALSLALETLEAADSDMHSRFSPVICKTAGEIMNSITDGKYDFITFDRSFAASIKASADPVGRGTLSLSCGTNDQLYLSLRLAMCEMLEKGEDPCPIILDDALANFDDERMKLALSYLKKLSLDRQILLFSCHRREADFFAGDSGVNIISM